jgi:hypothetical protein
MSMLGIATHSALDSVVIYDEVSLCEPICDEDTEATTVHTDVLMHVQDRFAQEMCLLRIQWRMLLFCFIIDVYGTLMLFRNLAFYRFRAGPRLTQDLGFDVLPEWRGCWTDSPILALQIALLSASFMCFVPRRRCPAPFVVNIWRRCAMMVAMGNILRFITYISTTLPGSAEHCLPSNPNIGKDQPKTVRDVLLRITVDIPGFNSSYRSSGTYNCGDLTFSGHILLAMTLAFCCVRYVPHAFMMTASIESWFKRWVWATVVIQCIFTIMARNHYTMDVVISLYLTPLLWSFYTTKMEPGDVQPTR